MTSSPLFAVYGATGHTGRLVVSRLRELGREVLLSGRDSPGLRQLGARLEAPVLAAGVEDAPALRRLAERADVVVHCAGPFSVTGAPVAAAAAEAGCGYVDHGLEPHHVKRVFDTLQAPAQRSGAVLVPGLSFYGGFGDLLAGAVAHGLPEVERVVIGYAVSGWRLTAAAKATASQLFAETQRITFQDGVLHTGYVEPRTAVFAFPPPLGPRQVITPMPFFEPITVPRHTPARAVDVQLTESTFQEPGTFESEEMGDEERAQSTFTVAVHVDAGPGGGGPDGGGRPVRPDGAPAVISGHLDGRDLWRAAALASVEGAIRLAEGRGPGKSGVSSPAEAWEPRELLRSLEAAGAFRLHLAPAAGVAPGTGGGER
ncbi:saccharopine dehydrogenase NADP-binding domain-containing protein [Phaeacidiphilus oryzae]|uniref:saccharopine dehydrogenase NADP-binding domain-containing protein n=1 Tax=Phaeacidiphilus oryzae TaxID=348818 RepID=UPI00068F981E|nr:saccharopine dehydrogenase NADP-binding domain-containing protein [Phaeacidiphilus oryzae]